MKRKILLVDDEPRMRRLLSLTLGDVFFLLEAGDGSEALRVARSEKPELVMLDVAMPGMDGLEICRRLKADPQTSAIPVVMVTGKDSQDDAQMGLEAGAEDYITKPFSPRTLLDKVTSIIGRYGGEDD